MVVMRENVRQQNIEVAGGVYMAQRLRVGVLGGHSTQVTGARGIARHAASR